MKSIIHFETPYKSRWVKQAQREGLKLVPWITKMLNYQPVAVDLDDLTAVRESFDLSVPRFARLLGVHRNTWRKWEIGEQSMPAIAKTSLRMLVFMRDNGLLSAWEKAN